MGNGLKFAVMVPGRGFVRDITALGGIDCTPQIDKAMLFPATTAVILAHDIKGEPVHPDTWRAERDSRLAAWLSRSSLPLL